MNAAINLGRTVLLCLIGGSADAIAYVRYGTFVGAMSGNTVLLGVSLIQERYDSTFYHACIIAVFLVAVIVTRLALDYRVPVLVPLFLTAALLGGSELFPDKWTAVLSAGALGMENAAVWKIGGIAVYTVFITGDLFRLGSAIPEPRQPEQKIQLKLLTTAWIAYAGGAVLGAAMLYLISHPMTVPAALAVVAAIVESVVHRRRPAQSQGAAKRER